MLPPLPAALAADGTLGTELGLEGIPLAGIVAEIEGEEGIGAAEGEGVLGASGEGAVGEAVFAGGEEDDAGVVAQGQIAVEGT